MATLPYDYEVEYIESTGTQWIDLGVKGDNTTTFDIIFTPLELPTATSSGKGTILGNRRAYNGNVFHLSTYTANLNSKGTFAYGNNGWNNSSTPTLGLTTGINRISLTDISVTTNQAGTTGKLMVVNGRNALCYSSTFETPYTLTLFALRRDNQESPMTEFIKMRFRKLILNDRCYIPVVKNNVACLYEQTYGNFYYNQGSDEFIAGSRVEPQPEPEEKKFLSLTNLSYLWEKIKTVFAPKSEINKIEGNYYNA